LCNILIEFGIPGLRVFENGTEVNAQTQGRGSDRKPENTTQCLPIDVSCHASIVSCFYVDILLYSSNISELYVVIVG